MSSRHVENDFLAYLEGRLPDRDKQRVEDHLEGCQSCQQALSGFQQVVKTAQIAAEQEHLVTPALSVKVMDELEGYAPYRHRRFGMAKRKRSWMSMAYQLTLLGSLCGVVLIASVTFLGRQASTTFSRVGQNMSNLNGNSQPKYLSTNKPIGGLHDQQQPQFNTEEYTRIYENEFLSVAHDPLSTFSIDVDTASYSNVRRFLTDSQRPPKDAVRIEELINYFSYDYPEPDSDRPFSITTEVSNAPWEKSHLLVHIGLKGKSIPTENLPANNLVFLLDVSGSMGSHDKLPLLKQAFKLLVKEMRPDDRVAIVVYAGAAGLVLPSTSGENKDQILEAITRLESGGSTAGGAGIQLAYKIARKNFLEGGNNRVILATDGDFNIGTSSTGALVRMIEQKREQGVFLTVLGFGDGNLKDSRMEQLADKGNGNYSYIDSIFEAKKVLVNEMGSTLVTIAKDVKLQIEFNPTQVKAYRLIGYENRLLAKEDFNDDTKDAGELGAGHTVTALYEVIPVGAEGEARSVDPLKYQQTEVKESAAGSEELMTVKLRYKTPRGWTSKLLAQSVVNSGQALAESSNNFRFSAAVAEFGMLLRDSKFKGEASYSQVRTLAKSARGEDRFGYRSEFIRLVDAAELLQ